MRMELVLKLIQAVVKCLKSLPILVTTLVNLKATEAWLAEHGFVHAGGNDYVKYDPLMIGDTSGSNYE